MKIAFCYRFLILGGVNTQLLNRLGPLRGKIEPHFLFAYDSGARKQFRQSDNVHVLAEPADRNRFFAREKFDLVSIIDSCEFYQPLLESGSSAPVLHEVHTTTSNIAYLDELRTDDSRLRLIRGLAAPSTYLVNRVLDEFGFRGVKPVFQIGNCLDTSVFQMQPDIERPERPIVLWIGKLDDHKNWEMFINMAGALAGRGFDGEFWIVGGQTAPEDKSRELFSAIGKHGLTQRVRWLCQVDYEAMPRLYSMVARSGGCLAVTSRDESFGMTLAEAMACQCPVVASAVGALPELVSDGESGLLFALDDLTAAIAAVERMLGDEVLRARCVEAGLRRVTEQCAPAPVAARYMQIAEELAGRRAASTRAS